MQSTESAETKTENPIELAKISSLPFGIFHTNIGYKQNTHSSMCVRARPQGFPSVPMRGGVLLKITGIDMALTIDATTCVELEATGDFKAPCPRNAFWKITCVRKI